MMMTSLGFVFIFSLVHVIVIIAINDCILRHRVCTCVHASALINYVIFGIVSFTDIWITDAYTNFHGNLKE